MPDLQHSWNQPPKPAISEQLGGIVKKEPPLKPQIEGTIKKLNTSISKLDNMSEQLHKKDAKLFQRIVQAQKNHDVTSGKVLAKELVELRKNEKMIGSIRLSLDQVNLRLTTFNALGDSIVTIGPAVATMRAVKPALAKFLPSASSEFDSMTNTLNDLVVDSLEAGFELDSSSNQETEKILREAAAVASTYTSDKFPSPHEAYSTSQTSSLEDL